MLSNQPPRFPPLKPPPLQMDLRNDQAFKRRAIPWHHPAVASYFPTSHSLRLHSQARLYWAKSLRPGGASGEASEVRSVGVTARANPRPPRLWELLRIDLARGIGHEGVLRSLEHREPFRRILTLKLMLWTFSEVNIFTGKVRSLRIQKRDPRPPFFLSTLNFIRVDPIF